MTQGATYEPPSATSEFVSATVQASHHPPARAYLARKLAEGKTPREARRALKRHLANVIYRRLYT